MPPSYITNNPSRARFSRTLPLVASLLTAPPLSALQAPSEAADPNGAALRKRDGPVRAQHPDLLQRRLQARRPRSDEARPGRGQGDR